jgi:hypothetical protein
MGPCKAQAQAASLKALRDRHSRKHGNARRSRTRGLHCDPPRASISLFLHQAASALRRLQLQLSHLLEGRKRDTCYQDMTAVSPYIHAHLLHPLCCLHCFLPYRPLHLPSAQTASLPRPRDALKTVGQSVVNSEVSSTLTCPYATTYTAESFPDPHAPHAWLALVFLAHVPSTHAGLLRWRGLERSYCLLAVR